MIQDINTHLLRQRYPRIGLPSWNLRSVPLNWRGWINYRRTTPFYALITNVAPVIRQLDWYLSLRTIGIRVTHREEWKTWIRYAYTKYKTCQRVHTTADRLKHSFLDEFRNASNHKSANHLFMDLRSERLCQLSRWPEKILILWHLIWFYLKKLRIIENKTKYLI